MNFYAKKSALKRQYWPFINDFCTKCNPHVSASFFGDGIIMYDNPNYYDNDPDKVYNMDFSLDTNDVENMQESDCSQKVSCRIRTDTVGFEEDDDNEFSLRQLFALSEYEVSTQKGIDEQCINSEITKPLHDVSFFSLY